MVYPYRGRIIRPSADDNTVGAVRTPSGERYVTTLYGGLRFSRRRSDNQGERSIQRSGLIGRPQFRFQTPVYLPDVLTDDELVLIMEDGRLEAYNIVTPAPTIGRPGLGGRRIGDYTVLLAQRKAEQNADMDIYL